MKQIPKFTDNKRANILASVEQCLDELEAHGLDLNTVLFLAGADRKDGTHDDFINTGFCRGLRSAIPHMIAGSMCKGGPMEELHDHTVAALVQNNQFRGDLERLADHLTH